MRKRSILGTMAGNAQRKATNAGTKLVYKTLLFGEEPKRRKKKDG